MVAAVREETSCYALFLRAWAVGFWLIFIGKGLHTFIKNGMLVLFQGIGNREYGLLDYVWLTAILLFFGICEGYRGFQQMFAPMLVRRAWQYSRLYNKFRRADDKRDENEEESSVDGDDEYPCAKNSFEEKADANAVFNAAANTCLVNEESGFATERDSLRLPNTARSDPLPRRTGRGSGSDSESKKKETAFASRPNLTAALVDDSCTFYIPSLCNRRKESCSIQTQRTLQNNTLYYTSAVTDFFLIPFMVGGFCYGSIRRLLVSWILLAFIITCVVLMKRYLEGKWLVFTCCGLFVGLGWGWCAMVGWSIVATVRYYKARKKIQELGRSCYGTLHKNNDEDDGFTGQEAMDDAMSSFVKLMPLDDMHIYDAVFTRMRRCQWRCETSEKIWNACCHVQEHYEYVDPETKGTKVEI